MTHPITKVLLALSVLGILATGPTALALSSGHPDGPIAQAPAPSPTPAPTPTPPSPRPNPNPSPVPSPPGPVPPGPAPH